MLSKFQMLRRKIEQKKEHLKLAQPDIARIQQCMSLPVIDIKCERRAGTSRSGNFCFDSNIQSKLVHPHVCGTPNHVFIQ